MKILVNGKEIGEVLTNRSLTITEAMYALGYNIDDPEDCEKGYEDDVEGFYINDDGNYDFDLEAAEMAY